MPKFRPKILTAKSARVRTIAMLTVLASPDQRIESVGLPAPKIRINRLKPSRFTKFPRTMGLTLVKTRDKCARLCVKDPNLLIEN